MPKLRRIETAILSRLADGEEHTGKDFWRIPWFHGYKGAGCIYPFLETLELRHRMISGRWITTKGLRLYVYRITDRGRRALNSF